MTLLPSSANIPPVQVYALATGELHHPDRWLFEDGDEDIMDARHIYPDYSFLVRHRSGKNILFDLGLTKVQQRPPSFRQSFPELVLNHCRTSNKSPS